MTILVNYVISKQINSKLDLLYDIITNKYFMLILHIVFIIYLPVSLFRTNGRFYQHNDQKRSNNLGRQNGNIILRCHIIRLGIIIH